MSYYDSLYNEPFRYSPPPRSYRRSPSPPPLEDDYLGWGRNSYSPQRRFGGTGQWSSDGTTYQYRSPTLNEFQYNSVDGEEQMYERRVEEPGHSEYFFESTKRTSSPSRASMRPSHFGTSPLPSASPTMGGGLGMGPSPTAGLGMGSPMSSMGNSGMGLGASTMGAGPGMGMGMNSGYGMGGMRPNTPPPMGMNSGLGLHGTTAGGMGPGMGPGMGMSSPTGLGMSSPTGLASATHMNTMSGSPSYGMGMGPSSPALGLGSPLSGASGYGPGGYRRDISPSYSRNFDPYESEYEGGYGREAFGRHSLGMGMGREYGREGFGRESLYGRPPRSYSPPPPVDEYEEIEEYTRTTTTTYY